MSPGMSTSDDDEDIDADSDSHSDHESSKKHIGNGPRPSTTQPRPSLPAGTPKTFTTSNGDPNTSTKRRRRSSSPVSPRGPGSAENPIHVDEIASLFEPIVIREYVCMDTLASFCSC
jgi:hypothetical protein